MHVIDRCRFRAPFERPGARYRRSEPRFSPAPLLVSPVEPACSVEDPDMAALLQFIDASDPLAAEDRPGSPNCEFSTWSKENLRPKKQQESPQSVEKTGIVAMEGCRVVGVKRSAPTLDSTGKTRTYTARKTEIQDLLAEIPLLKTYIDHLQQQAASATNQVNSVAKQQLINEGLRATARKQEIEVLKTHSAVTEYASKQDSMLLLDSFLHLEASLQARIEALRNVQPGFIKNAKLYTQSRIQHVALITPSTETHSYVSPSGHHCMQKFVSMPLEGVSDVRLVFDKLKYFLGRLEVLISEKTGDVTICDEVVRVNNKDSGDGFAQHHMLRSTPTGYQVQSNEVTFESFQERDDEFGEGRSLGVIVIRSVDKDDSYPYKPEKTLRQDVTSVFTVRSFKRRLSPGKKSLSPQSGGCVVVTRCCFHKLHKSSLRVSRMDLEDTLEELSRRGDVLLRAVRNSCCRPRPMKKRRVATEENDIGEVFAL